MQNNPVFPPEPQKKATREEAGLPLLGRTLDFLKDPFALIQQGLERGKPAFFSSVLGEPIVFIAGPEACELWSDPDKIERNNAQPPHVKQIFGDDDVLPLLDDDAHFTRRQHVLSAFTPAALASYLPQVQETLSSHFESWTQAEDTLHSVPALKTLALEMMGRTILGLQDGPELKRLVQWYMGTDGALTALPLPVPGSAFMRMRKSVQQILDFLFELGQQRRLNPGQDAYSRILESKNEQGSRLSIEKASYEAHHCILGGYIIWGELAMILRQLAQNPALYHALKTEIDTLESSELTPKTLSQLPQLLNFVLETKRLTPIIPGQFARARCDFSFAGLQIQRGTRVFLGVHASNQGPEIYPEPHHFDPERFERGEHLQHPQAFTPQGTGSHERSHRCPGLDFSTVIMQCFSLMLLRDYRWELPPQNLEYNYGLIPPEPQDGLRLRFERVSHL